MGFFAILKSTLLKENLSFYPLGQNLDLSLVTFCFFVFDMALSFSKKEKHSFIKFSQFLRFLKRANLLQTASEVLIFLLS